MLVQFALRYNTSSIIRFDADSWEGVFLELFTISLLATLVCANLLAVPMEEMDFKRPLVVT